MSYAALPVLWTPRLELRPLTDQDADALARGVGNYDVSRWLAVVPYPYDADDARRFIQRVHAQDKPFWGIHNAHGLIGVVSLDDELAYWVARPFWGKGYGFEAAHAAVQHWFADTRAGDLASGYFDGNDRSGKVLQALGFRPFQRVTRYAKSFQQDVVSNQMRLTRKDWDARLDMTLYTPRLTLRPLEKRDAAPFSQMMVPEVTRMLSRHKTGMTEAEVLADLPRRRWRGHLGFTLAIEMQGRMIGTIGVGGTPPCVGYFLSPDVWGQGIMTEALAAFLPAVFARFPVSRIHADHFEDNPASGAVMRKLGFEETGREMGKSIARVEEALLITYAVERDKLRVPV